MANLREQLIDKNKKLNRITPIPMRKQFEKFTRVLKENNQEAKALNVGAKIPDGILLNHMNEKVSMKKLLKGKPAIISFYRGSWCPYCNLELRAYDQLLSENSLIGTSMFAISPEQVDVTLETVDIEKLHFNVLSDTNNAYAKKMKLVFTVSKMVTFLYRLAGISLKKSQGNDQAELPIPATYIVDGNGIIKNAWVDADYTKRAEPAQVIAAYKKVEKSLDT